MDVQALTINTVSGNFTMNYTPPTGFQGPVTAPEGCKIFPFSLNNPWENPEDIVTHDTLKIVSLALYGCLMPFFFLLAVPLNIINMIVFYRHGIKERINLCLFFLALDDLIVVVSIFEMKMDFFFGMVDGNYPWEDKRILKANVEHMLHTSFAFIHISRFMCVLIAVERCLCVVSPLKARTMIDTRTTAFIIGAGHVVIFACYFLYGWKFEVICLYDPFIREKRTEMVYTQFYIENKRLIDNYDSYLLGMVMIGGFDVCVMVSTVMTLLKMNEMREWRGRSSSNVSTQQLSIQNLNLTRMLIANNIFFVMCTTPFLIYHVAILIVPELNTINGSYTSALIWFVTDVLAAINSTASFFFFLKFGSKFRRSVLLMFSRSNKKKGNE